MKKQNKEHEIFGGSPDAGEVDAGSIIHTKTVEVTDNEITGKVARRVRERAGLSLRDVAKRMKVSAPYLSDLELGRRQWKEKTAQKFVDALKQ